MTSKIVVNNIEADAGISTITFINEVTAPTFNGNITGTAATFTTGTFSGNVDIAGALTYEDVTNVDSVGIITAQSDISIADKIVHTGDTNTAIRFPAADTFTVETGGDEALRVDSSQRLLVGTTSLISSSVAANFQVASDFGPRFNIARSDTTTAADNLIGAFDFYGNDSNGTYQNCARILAEADLDHGTDDKPTRLTFYTTPDGSATPTERLRITGDGEVRVNNAAGASVGLNLYQISGAAAQVRFQGSATGTGEGDGFGLGNSGAVNAYVWNYEAGHIQFATSNSPRLTITSGGEVLIGHATASNLSGGFTKALAIEGTGAADSSIGLVRNAADDNPPYIYFGKSRGSTAGANNAISNGDHIGMVNFAGARSSGSFGDAVNLRANADNSFSAGSSPGRFSVWTTPVNSTSPLESLRVDSTGAVVKPRNVAFSYRRTNSNASWGSNSGLTYSSLSYRTPIPLFGASGTDYDSHSSLATFSIGGGSGIKFTAPVAGKYMVTLNMSSVKNNVNDDWGSIGLMVNTVSPSNSGSLDYMLDTNYHPDTTSTGNQFGIGGSVIINLSQNDYIVPYSMSVQNFSGDNQFFFQGYLLG